jgi:hypothetical protein
MTTMLQRAARLAAAAIVFPLCLTAAAQAPRPALAGDYALTSSTTAPVGTWVFTKGRMSIKKLDERHLLILIACQWKREPKAICSEHYIAQWQDSGLYIQDMNTDPMRLYFDPATRTLTVVTRGFDAKESVRRDVYTPDNSELTDPALVRRMKREQGAADSKENARVFGHYAKWAYTNNRIEFQKQ